MGTDCSLSGVGADYADLIGNPSSVSGANYVTAYFNTAAFQQAAIGTFGNSTRGLLRGPGSLNLDASGFKVFPIRDCVKLQFRAEAFNVINRTNYNNPGSPYRRPRPSERSPGLAPRASYSSPSAQPSNGVGLETNLFAGQRETTSQMPTANHESHTSPHINAWAKNPNDRSCSTRHGVALSDIYL